MKNTTIELVCDHVRHGGQEIDAVGTRSFSIDGVDYEIDLCAKDDKEFDVALAPYLDKARTVKRGRVVKRSVASRQRSRRIRAWAAEHMPDVDLSDKGRLPGRVIREYENRAA